MSPLSPATTERTALRLRYAISGWLIAILMIAVQISGAIVALRDHSAVEALRFLIMLPLTLMWCFIMSLFLPAKVKSVLVVSPPKIPSIGVAAFLYILFASFVTNYGFK
jgi:hypothetical protein